MGNRISYTLCALFPGAAMAGAHWFPWRRMGRELHRLEAYAIGTAAIVGTSTVAILSSDGDREDHARLLSLATLSAGVVTLAAWAIDALLDKKAEGSAKNAYDGALHDLGSG